MYLLPSASGPEDHIHNLNTRTHYLLVAAVEQTPESWCINPVIALQPNELSIGARESGCRAYERESCAAINSKTLWLVSGLDTINMASEGLEFMGDSNYPGIYSASCKKYWDT